MALGDGDTWDETNPTNATVGVNIDDYDRDLRKGVRSRMAHEHEWPASQSATSEAGRHKFVTMQLQSTQPTLSGTQIAALYIKTVGTRYEVFFARASTGAEEIQITTTGGLNIGLQSFLQLTSTLDGVFATGTASVTTTTMMSTAMGDQFYELAITPRTATSIIEYEGVLVANVGDNNNAMIGMFVNTFGTASGNTVYVQKVPELRVHGFFTVTSTAVHTFKLRAGDDTGDTFHVNGITSTLGGGAQKSGIVLKEFKA